MKIAVVIALVLCYFAYVNAVTPVRNCPQGKTAEEFKQTISVGNCKKPPCRLRKQRTVKTEFRFTPDREVKSLVNTVNALLGGIPFPFIGVDGTDACDLIYESDGTTKTQCPLQKGKEYVYKRNVEVLGIYPRLKLVVHWALTAQDGQDVLCFEVPARITN